MLCTIIYCISHVTLNIIIWWISSKQDGMKKIWLKFHFNQNLIDLWKHNVLDEIFLLSWFIIYVMTFCLGKEIFLL